MSDNVKGFIYIVIATCAFGTMPVLSRIAILNGGNSTTILLSRFVIVSLFYIIYMKYRGLSWNVGKKNSLALVALGFIAYGNVAMLFFLAMKYISPAVGEMLLYTYPAMVTIGAVIFLNEGFSVKKGLSLLLALGGCALVLWAPDLKIDFRGVVLALLTALFYAIYILGNRKLLDSIHPVVAAAYMAVCCCVYFALVGAFTGELNFHYNMTLIAVILIFAFWSTIAGMLCFLKGLKLLGATKASITSTFEPAFTVALSYVILHDKVTWIQIVGGALILGSVLLLQEFKKRKAEEPEYELETEGC